MVIHYFRNQKSYKISPDFLITPFNIATVLYFRSKMRTRDIKAISLPVSKCFTIINNVEHKNVN